MKSAIALVSLLLAACAFAQQDKPAATAGAQSTPQQSMSGCMPGMSSGQGGMGSQGGMMGCSMMSQDKDKDAKGMCSCCGNMGKEQPKNPA